MRADHDKKRTVIRPTIRLYLELNEEAEESGLSMNAYILQILHKRNQGANQVPAHRHTPRVN